jgi:hypothetical protein
MWCAATQRRNANNSGGKPSGGGFGGARRLASSASIAKLEQRCSTYLPSLGAGSWELGAAAVTVANVDMESSRGPVGSEPQWIAGTPGPPCIANPDPVWRRSTKMVNPKAQRLIHLKIDKAVMGCSFVRLSPPLTVLTKVRHRSFETLVFPGVVLTLVPSLSLPLWSCATLSNGFMLRSRTRVTSSTH